MKILCESIYILLFVPLQNAVKFIEQIIWGFATNEAVKIHHFVSEFCQFD